MKHLLFIFLLVSGLTILAPMCPAQAPMPQNPEEQDMKEIPQWLVDFSNLPKDKREQYLTHFNRAKYAYHQSQWIECIAQLAECEIILRGNPSIWNLRASCLLEQKYFKEAEEELLKVLQVEPNDPVTIMNLANVHMACERFEQSLQIVMSLRENLYLQHAADELLYLLDFRALLCYLRLGQKEKARTIATSVSPMADTPLYYYSKAAIALSEGKRADAVHYLSVVERIFANNRACIPYQRALELSGLLSLPANATAPTP